MWFYTERVLIAYQVNDAAAHNRPRGNLSDLYPRWLGARELLLRGRDPYSPPVTREIQEGFYGRALDPSQPDEPEDQEAFAYPAYVVFLLAPTLTLPFSLVQRLFFVLLLLLTSASVPLWLRVLRWRPPASVIAIFVILLLGSLPAVQGIKLQQLSLLVAGLLAGCAASLSLGYLIFGGFLLALCTIKPQLALLPMLWWLAWAISDWRKRQRLVWAFGATMLLLLLGAEMVLPGWVGRFRIAIMHYRQYTHSDSLLAWMFTPLLGYVLTVFLCLLTAGLCWRFLPAHHDSPEFGAAGSLVLALTVVIVPMMAPYNQVLLLPTILLLVCHRAELCGGKSVTRILYLVTAAALFWPWVASLGLSLASFILPAATVQSGWKLPFVTTFTLPLFVFALAALYAAKIQFHSRAG